MTRSEFIDHHTLARYIPLQSIPSASLQKIARENPVTSLPAGRVIFNRGQQDNLCFYLLEGKVQLSYPEQDEVIVAGTTEARLPLDQHQPRQATAHTLTDVKLIRLNSNLIEIMTSEIEPGIEVEEIQEKDIGVRNQLTYRLYRDYLNGELSLASLPELAIRVRRAVQNPSNTIQKISKIIQSDPVIAAQIIRVANSPLYRSGTPVNDCQNAIARIGLLNTRDMVTSLTIRQLFKPKTKLVQKQMAELWKHSTHVAAIASIITKMVPQLNPDRALLAGLIHDIGKLAILSYAEQFPELVMQEKLLQETLKAMSPQVGALVLRHWAMASDLVEVALHADDWQRDSEFGPDYCDIVIVSQLHAYAGTEQAVRLPKLIDLKAFQKIPLSRKGPEKSLEVLTNARQAILEMQQLLH